MFDINAIRVPDAPTSLTATASGTTTINLSWTAPPNNGGSVITGYKIEVSSNGGTSWTDRVANTNSTSTTYSHTGLSPGTTRHYRVSAINSVGTGTASNVDNATTTLSTDATLSALALSGVTFAPTFASATETYTATVVNSVMQTTVTATQTHSGATVTFKDGDDNALTNPVTLAEGDNVIKAVVTAEDTTTMKTYMVTVTRATITATTCLTPNLTGRMQIWTGTVTVGTLDLGENPIGYGFGTGYGALDDTQFSVGVNGYTVDGANVDADGTTTAGRLAFSLTGALATADIVGLTLHVCDAAFALADATVNSTQHTYNWASAGLDWSSDTSRTLYLSVPSDDTTAPSPAIAAVASDGIVVAVVFDEALAQPAPTLSASAFTLTADGVELDIQNMSFGADTLLLNLASGTKIYRGETVRLSYDKTVAGADALEDAAGNEVASFTDFAVTNNSTVVNNPPMIFSEETLRMFENTSPGVDVGGHMNATDADNDPLIFTLEGTDAASFNLVTFPGSARLRTKTGVTYDYETKSSYSVIVKVDDGHGGTDTVSVTIEVADVAEPPARPAAPSVSSVADSTTSLLVTWTAPENTGRPAIDHYDLQYRQGTTGDWTDGPQDVPGPSATIMSLTANTLYQVQVLATNDEGDSPWSPAGSGRTNTAGNTAPTFPLATADREVTENTAAGQNVGDALTATDGDNDPLAYTLEGTDAASFNLVTISGSAQIRTRSGVTYDYETKSSYSVTVKVDDGHGGTDTVMVTIDVGDVNEKPDTPTAPRVTGTSGSTPSLDVRWTKPGLNGGPDITGYEVQYRKGTSGPFTATSHSGTGTSSTITELTRTRPTRSR